MESFTRASWMSEGDKGDYEIVKGATVVTPCVSVIVPVYNMNERGYLKPLIASLKAQTLANIEFILIDDCSTDDSLPVMCELTKTDARFTVISSKVNGRQGAARNKGLDVARGQYIGFVDGDDVIDRTFFEWLYHLAVSDGLDIATAPFVLTDENLNISSDLIWQFDRGLTVGDYDDCLPELILHPAHIVLSIYSSRLFNNGMTRFPENVYFEDNPTALRLLCLADSVGLLPESRDVPKYYYRQHATSTDHRIDNLIVQIRDRVVTSDFIMEDARATGYLRRSEEAIGLYYLKICLLNTASKIALFDSWSKRKEAIVRVRNHVAAQVTLDIGGPVFKELGLKERASFVCATKLPNFYVQLLHVWLAAKREQDY